MRKQLDMDKISAALGAERRGEAKAHGGYFGAMQLVAEVEHRLRTPAGGGRPRDPELTERRLVGLSPVTLARLDAISRRIRVARNISLSPMQVAAVLLEQAAGQLVDEDIPLPDDLPPPNLVAPR